MLITKVILSSKNSKKTNTHGQVNESAGDNSAEKLSQRRMETNIEGQIKKFEIFLEKPT